MEEKQQKKCLSCGEPIYGRSDKKFCGDACRNAYHYEHNHQHTNMVRKINAILSRNYNVLQELNVSGKTSVTRRQLIDKGFDFKYFTHIYTTKAGAVYYIIYDEAYLKKEGGEDAFLLVRFEEKNNS